MVADPFTRYSLVTDNIYLVLSSVGLYLLFVK